MLMAGIFTGGSKLKLFFGDENSPWSWATRPPDRVIPLIGGQTPLITLMISPADLDGDGSDDLFGRVYTGTQAGSYIYLSSAGKSARTRSFSLDDADIIFRSRKFQAWGDRLGYLNDSTRRYEMLELGGVTPSGGDILLAFSGGPQGPDPINDAYYIPADDGLYDGEPVFSGNSTTVPDVTGDGWDDFLGVSSQYGAFVHQGIALILAGGPYIPRDSATLSVRDVAIAGKPAALSLWPNPVHEELNIAWRGDLKRMPARFEVHDMSGRLIASGSVEPWRGSAIWCADGIAAGAYLLTAFDNDNTPIATTTVWKQ
jgi:hypothetical protein